MNSRLRPRILYALGWALMLCVYSMPPGSAFAQPSETPGSASEHTRGASATAAAPLRAGTVSKTEHTRVGGVHGVDSATTPTPRTAVDPSAISEGARAQAGVVNLNTATTGELERLPRIGPARAQAILALRAKVTRFSKVEQLLRVKGIGRATFRKLRPMLTLDGPTTLPERRRR